ncbi:terminase small subunit [Staphylococcus hominis]|uniref:terminase small subunit n=1 Tax=Staphylococcus hominis TaxID=1290 RepID=UPI000C7E2CD3|nr:terminase small subunit [Staphylococcus hominis]MCI2895976.1 terminase small subunit [Staphylococcus hominis]MCI2904486.1 terminase small subunit [Staphylococcus hominis]MCI2906606.1 terminase small subunit [Staphylococcus hominis]MCI2913010.1 terminase small subunit [Staphylococcus hominis]MCT1471186.1 terminase small subunit [Staphylococcus hominis]
MKKLTTKQRRFVDEYIETGNPYYSAIKVGYSEVYARDNALKLLENISVKSYIHERLEEIKNDNMVENYGVMRYLTRLIK